MHILIKFCKLRRNMITFAQKQKKVNFRFYQQMIKRNNKKKQKWKD